MIYSILALLSLWVVKIISFLGYPGIFILMALQSVNIPIPSEIILSFSGFLASAGRFGLIWVVLAGTLGNIVGASINYFIGFWGGKFFFRRYAHYWFSPEKETMVQGWIKRWGGAAVFVSQIVPMARTYIALPAGLMKMNFYKFISLVGLGALIWSFILSYIGFLLGERWRLIEQYFKKFDYLIIIVIGLFIIVFVIRYFRKK